VLDVGHSLRRVGRALVDILATEGEVVDGGAPHDCQDVLLVLVLDDAQALLEDMDPRERTLPRLLEDLGLADGDRHVFDAAAGSPGVGDALGNCVVGGQPL